MVYGRPTLGQLVGSAELVARARIEETSELVMTASGERRPAVSATLLELLKGESDERRVRFVQHGHGVAPFTPGEEVLLLLQPIAASRELAALGGSAERPGVDWVSVQEHDAKFGLDDQTRDAVGRAVRDYVALGGVADPAERLAAWRRLILRLLRSPDPRLAASALGDLIRGGPEMVTPESAAALDALVADPARAIGVRIGVLAELERRGFVASTGRWAELLRTAAPSDRLAVVRAVAAHPGPEVQRELVRLLADDDPVLVSAAAVSLGVPGNVEAVGPLARVLRTAGARERLSAIRGLGRIATPEAVAVLEEASRTHADRATRERAAAELRRLRGPAPAR